MPRVQTQTKSNRGRERHCGRAGCGKKIEPGERYYQFSFRYGGTHFRCAAHYPRPSELTQSKMSAVYAAIEDAEDQLINAGLDDMAGIIEAVAEAVDEVASEYRDAGEAMGEAGYENQERADELDGWSSELQGFETPEPEESEEETRERATREFIVRETRPSRTGTLRDGIPAIYFELMYRRGALERPSLGGRA